MEATMVFENDTIFPHISPEILFQQFIGWSKQSPTLCQKPSRDQYLAEMLIYEKVWQFQALHGVK